MASSTYNFDTELQTSRNQLEQPEDGDEEPKSSLSRTFGNVIHLVSDGLYRIKNRHKAE